MHIIIIIILTFDYAALSRLNKSQGIFLPFFCLLKSFWSDTKSSVLLFLNSASSEDCCPPHCGAMICLCVPTPGNCAGFKLDALYNHSSEKFLRKGPVLTHWEQWETALRLFWLWIRPLLLFSLRGDEKENSIYKVCSFFFSFNKKRCFFSTIIIQEKDQLQTVFESQLIFSFCEWNTLQNGPHSTTLPFQN